MLATNGQTAKPQLDETIESRMAEPTPHASKAAATLQIEAAELTALSSNPKSKTVPFKRPIRVRFGGKNREEALRCPFGAPNSYEASRTDRVSFSVSVDPEGAETAFAQKLNKKAQDMFLARLQDFVPKATEMDVVTTWHHALKPGKTTTGLPSR